MSADAFQRFEVWFGCLFLGLGLLALLIAAVLYTALARSPRYRPMRWAFLGAPVGIGVIFSLIGAGSAGYGLWQFGIEQRILANGTTVQAVVTEVEQTYTRVNGRYLWRVRYQYADGNGTAHWGASGLLDIREAQTWRSGDLVFVRYDPSQPSTSVWLGREDRAAAAPRPLMTPQTSVSWSPRSPLCALPHGHNCLAIISAAVSGSLMPDGSPG